MQVARLRKELLEERKVLAQEQQASQLYVSRMREELSSVISGLHTCACACVCLFACVCVCVCVRATVFHVPPQQKQSETETTGDDTAF